MRADGGGYELEVRYARVARPGLSVPWTVTIGHPGGKFSFIKVDGEQHQPDEKLLS